MKKSVLKGALLFTTMIALAAPAAASAAVWGPVGTTGALDSTNLTFQTSTGSWSCSSSHLGVSVRNPASSTLDVTAATFSGCVGLGGMLHCTVTMTAAGLPWTAQALSATNVKVNVADIAIVWTGVGCAFTGGTAHMSGSITSGTWVPATHTVTFSSTGGLSIPGIGLVTVSGALRNPTQTLTLT